MQQEDLANLSVRIDAILLPLLNQDKEITIRQIGCALGYNPDYLQSCPHVIDYVRKIIHDHNTQVEQRRHHTIWTCISQILEALPNCTERVTLDSIARQAGLSPGQLQKRYPDLNFKVKQAVERHRLQLKTMQIQTQCTRINEEASQLAARGSRLTHKAILREAGMCDRAISFDMTVQDLLRKWVGNFAPRD
jgi:AraC-like DNA-binding protein